MKNYTPSLSELEARLEKLERQNRRLKSLGLGFLLIVLSGLLLAQTSHKPAHAAPASAASVVTYDTLVVHRLELRDEAGKLRGLLVVKNGVPSLSLYDDAGKLRAWLYVTRVVPYFDLLDAAGKTRALLQVLHEVPGLWFYDPAGKLRVALGVTPEGPGLKLYGAAGKGGVDINQNSLSVTDVQGFESVVGVTGLETPATGETHTTSAASVTLFGKDRKVIWHAP
jgi:hypothetical protein